MPLYTIGTVFNAYLQPLLLSAPNRKEAFRYILRNQDLCGYIETILLQDGILSRLPSSILVVTDSRVIIENPDIAFEDMEDYEFPSSFVWENETNSNGARIVCTDINDFCQWLDHDPVGSWGDSNEHTIDVLEINVEVEDIVRV